MWFTIYNNICTADGFSPEFIQLPRFKYQSAIIGDVPIKVQTILSEEFIQGHVLRAYTDMLQESMYTKTCLKRPLKNRQNKDLNDKDLNGSLMKVESIAECSLGAFCNTFDLH